MILTGFEKIDLMTLRKTLLDVTSRGPVVEWYDRLKEYAIQFGIRPETICWYNSPESIAHEIIKRGDRKVMEQILEAQWIKLSMM